MPRLWYHCWVLRILTLLSVHATLNKLDLCFLYYTFKYELSKVFRVACTLRSVRMLITQQWYQSLGLFSCYTCKRAEKPSFDAVCPADSPSPWMDSPSPRQNASNSPSWFMHSTSWTPRQHKFDLFGRNWTRNITLRCFWTYKLVFDVVMFILIQFQRDNCQ